MDVKKRARLRAHYELLSSSDAHIICECFDDIDKLEVLLEVLWKTHPGPKLRISRDFAEERSWDTITAAVKEVLAARAKEASDED